MSAVEGRKRIRPDYGLPLSSFPPEDGSPSKRASTLRLADFPSPANSASPDLAFLEDLCDASSSITEEEECLLAEMIRSLEKEIFAPVAQTVQVGALISPQESLRQLFEASDDELGLPSTSASTHRQGVADLCSISSAADDLSSVASALLADVPGPASHRTNLSGGCSGEGGCAASVGAVHAIARDYLYEDIVALDGCL